MRLTILTGGALLAALGAACTPPGIAPASLAAAPAVTSGDLSDGARGKTLLLSAGVGLAAANALSDTCSVVFHLHNLSRSTVAMVGRVEGRIGDESVPSVRSFRFDSVRPGGIASDTETFDGTCDHDIGDTRSRGSIMMRGLLMCHEDLSYVNCREAIGSERDTTPGEHPLDVSVDITDWAPGGV